MGRDGRSLSAILATAFCIMCLAGCSPEELLSEVPRTMQIVQEEAATAAPAEEKNTVNTKDAQEYVQEENTVQETLFLLEESSDYAYNSLSPEEQIWYLDIETALGSMSEKVRLSDTALELGLDEQHIDRIFQCVLNDHPEIFYVDGYTYTKYSRGDKTVGIVFDGKYQYAREEVLRRKQEIEQAAEAILAEIDAQASEYDKVKYVFETLIRNTEYDLQAPDNQNIYSVFSGRASVCQGYAKATQYLLNRLGVECTMVQGIVDGEGHAWNLVRVDGSYYYVDTTWGDASYRLEEGMDSSQMPEINYDYLCVTTEQLLVTHIPESIVPMPECVDNAANYYVRQGALFTDYNREQMQMLFTRAAQEGNTDVTVKCADAECYQVIKDALIEQQDIFDYLPESELTVSYAHNDKQLSLTFWVTNQ